MAVTTTRLLATAADAPGTNPATTGGPGPVLGEALQPGVMLLGGAGMPRYADRRALALLGCRDGAELAALWAGVQPHLAALREAPAGGLELPAVTPGGRRLRIALVRVDGCEAGSGGQHEAANDDWRETLLVQDAEVPAALESDLRAASQMRSLAQITPAVAHDLRAPINAMVLNLEVLKETLNAGPAATLLPGGHPGRDPRERQRRYVAVLREELTRLHQSLELFIAHVSPRGDRLDSLDLREPVRDLAALLLPPARKQQAHVELLLPDAPVPVLAQRHQLRQALLHVGLAALARVPSNGTLELRLERLPSSAAAGETTAAAAAPAPPEVARLRLTTVARPGTGSGSDAGQPAPSPASDAPAALEPHFAAAGTEARLAVARSLVAALGGSLRLPAAEAGETGQGAGASQPRETAGHELVFSIRESD
jgi:signal transduction histidine kinase